MNCLNCKQYIGNTEEYWCSIDCKEQFLVYNYNIQQMKSAIKAKQQSKSRGVKNEFKTISSKLLQRQN